MHALLARWQCLQAWLGLGLGGLVRVRLRWYCFQACSGPALGLGLGLGLGLRAKG